MKNYLKNNLIEVLLVGHQLQMVVLGRDINYKTILMCLCLSFSLQRDGRPLVFYIDGWSLPRI